MLTGVFPAGLPLSLPRSDSGTVQLGVLGGSDDAPRQPAGVIETGSIVMGTLDGPGRAGRPSGPGGHVGPTDVFTPPGPPSGKPPIVAQADIQPARLLSPVTPAYTDEARRLRSEGVVHLQVRLGRSGDVRVLNVIDGPGHGLNESAVDAVNRTRCVPALENGRPIDVIATISVVFKLT